MTLSHIIFLAEVYLEKGEYQMALEYIEEALDIFPNNREANDLMGRIKNRSGS